MEAKLTQAQAAFDAASGAYGSGLAQYERGQISPKELGQLKRALGRAEKTLRTHQYGADGDALTSTRPGLQTGAQTPSAPPLTKPQRAALEQIARQPEGSMCLNWIKGRMVNCYRVARSLEDKGLVTRTNAGRVDIRDILANARAGHASLSKQEE